MVADEINIRSTINFPAPEINIYDAASRKVMSKKINGSASFSFKELIQAFIFMK